MDQSAERTPTLTSDSVRMHTLIVVGGGFALLLLVCCSVTRSAAICQVW
jgi:hypothetical protein